MKRAYFFTKLFIISIAIAALASPVLAHAERSDEPNACVTLEGFSNFTTLVTAQKKMGRSGYTWRTLQSTAQSNQLSLSLQMHNKVPTVYRLAFSRVLREQASDATLLKGAYSSPQSNGKVFVRITNDNSPSITIHLGTLRESMKPEGRPEIITVHTTPGTTTTCGERNAAWVTTYSPFKNLQALKSGKSSVTTNATRKERGQMCGQKAKSKTIKKQRNQVAARKQNRNSRRRNGARRKPATAALENSYIINLGIDLHSSMNRIDGMWSECFGNVDCIVNGSSGFPSSNSINAQLDKAELEFNLLTPSLNVDFLRAFIAPSFNSSVPKLRHDSVLRNWLRDFSDDNVNNRAALLHRTDTLGPVDFFLLFVDPVNPFDGNERGRAFLGNLCSGDATAVIEYGSRTSDYISSLIAHEMGHGFGAGHIDSPSNIMMSSLSWETLHFLPASMTTMRTQLETYYGRCIPSVIGASCYWGCQTTATATPTATPTATSTATATATATASATPTSTKTATATATSTPTPTSTSSGSGNDVTPTSTPTATATHTSTATHTATRTPTATATATRTSTATATPTATSTTPPPPPVVYGITTAISLSVSTTPKTITFSTFVNAVSNSCQVEIRAGTSAQSARNGTILKRFVPTENTSTHTASVTRRIATPLTRRIAKRKQATDRIFFNARATCVSVVRNRKLRTARFSGTSMVTVQSFADSSLPTVSNIAWIRTLVGQLK